MDVQYFFASTGKLTISLLYLQAGSCCSSGVDGDLKFSSMFSSILPSVNILSQLFQTSFVDGERKFGSTGAFFISVDHLSRML